MGKIKYEHKTWYDKNDTENAAKRIPLSAANLNRIEDGIQESFDELAYANLKNLVVQKITSSSTWTAPKAVQNKFKVFCVGGGGGGGDYYYQSEQISGSGGGGGGGYITIGELEIEENTTVNVICGAGGAEESDGGESRFGDFLVASGGMAGQSGYRSDSSKYITYGGEGGAGGAGGGGGCGHNTDGYDHYGGDGGDGDRYGGAGGGGNINFYKRTAEERRCVGHGGATTGSGGHGGEVDGSPIIGQYKEIEFIDCLFNAEKIIGIKAPANIHSGSGGINCNGGTNSGGGGGYCGNGGDGTMGSELYAGGAGGGGGYFGNGGNGYRGGGGGGGFFCNGGDGGGNAGNTSSIYRYGKGGGGGGFFCDGKGVSGGDGGVLIMYIKDDTQEEG